MSPSYKIARCCLAAPMTLCIVLTAGCHQVSQVTLKPSCENTMFLNVNAAAISFKPQKYDCQGNTNKIEKLFRTAAAHGAQLALAPEGAVEGYVIKDFTDKKNPPQDMLKIAITTNDPIIKRFQNLARELDMSLAFGFAERIGSQVYNAAIFIDNHGRIRGKYHKMQFAEGYDDSWWFNRLGKKNRAFNTPFGRCGFLICNDRWNPDIARIAVLDGAQYLLIPAFGSCSENQDRAVMARARENGIPIVEANVGVTLIISKGEIVVISREEETITYGTISIPAPPTWKNHKLMEQYFLNQRPAEMEKRYKQRHKEQ